MKRYSDAPHRIQIIFLMAALVACVIPRIGQAAIKGETCPADDFPKFFELFSEKAKFQEKYTSFPLETTSIVDGNPEPKMVIEKIEKGQMTFPFIPNSIERINRGLSIRTKLLRPDQAVVTLFKEDTDYLIEYVFRKKRCWQLYRIENSSF